MMHVVGLGGSKQDAVDLSGKQRIDPGVRAGLETVEDFRQCILQDRKSLGTGIDCLQGIDKHDLPVKPGKVLPEKRTHDHILVGFEALASSFRAGCRLRSLRLSEVSKAQR